MAIAKGIVQSTCKYLPLLINNNRKVNDFVDHLMPVFRPSWKKEKIRVLNINEGLGVTNELIGVDIRDDVLLIRVNGPNSELFIDRKMELVVLCLLAQAGINPPVYCQFTNGLCYGCVKGRTLKLDELKDSTVLHRIAKTMAKFHTLKLPDEYESGETVLICYFDKLYNLIPDVFHSSRLREVFVSKQTLKVELSDMISLVETLTSPVVLCHNDLQCGNIIHNVEEGLITFIDMEYAGMNHSACEIGDFFSEFAGLDPPNYTRYPSEVEQKIFIKMYLEESTKLKGN